MQYGEEGKRPVTIFVSVALVVWVTVFIILGVLFVLVKKAYGADVNEAVCLTKQEARAIYPKDWLYWHGKNRCWDNIPSRRYTARHVRAEAIKPVAEPKAKEPTIIWPAITTKPINLVREMFMASQMTGWPSLLDIDEITGPPKEDEDYCCWPPLDDLIEKRWPNQKRR